MGLWGKILLTVLGLIVLALLVLQTPLLAKARGASWSLVVRNVASVFRVGALDILPDVQSQLEELQVTNIRLKAESADYRRLREELGSHSFESLRPLSALVISRPIDSFRSEFVINRGAKDGVTLKSPVIIKGGQLIGFVSTLHEHSAVVRLLLNPIVTTSARVLDVERAEGLVRGRAHTALLLTKIPRDVTLTNGQIVVTVANATTPEGLTLGTIATIKENSSTAYQEAQLAFSYDPDTIRAVQVLVSP